MKAENRELVAEVIGIERAMREYLEYSDELDFARNLLETSINMLATVLADKEEGQPRS